MLPVALTIAGSDPSGGAGVQADLKTFHRFHVYGESVLTLITAQNTMAVDHVEILAADLVARQLRAVLVDIPPAAAKTGALGNQALVTVVAEAARGFTFPLVVDPVMISKHGRALLDTAAIEALRKLLLPCAALITPNLAEAEALTGRVVATIDDMRIAARALVEAGAGAALVKGGHLAGDAVDVLFIAGEFLELRAPRIATPHTHGTGCTYSAAIVAGLASGLPMIQAVQDAKAFITLAIASAPGLGAGHGPVNHFA